jgi:DNA-binding transcriptional ArsR family regulator
MFDKTGSAEQKSSGDNDLVRIMQCLSHIDRLRIMDALGNKELPVSKISALVGLDDFSVRLYLRELQNQELIASRMVDGTRLLRVAIPEIMGALELIKAVAMKKSSSPSN